MCHVWRWLVFPVLEMKSIMRNLSIVLLGMLALVVWAKPAHAAESYANCNNVVTALPTTITTPGVWCVKQSLTSASATANGITVLSDNVTLDCNDFVISDTAGTGVSGIGIYTKDHVNDTVRHCNVQGFRYGLYFQSTGAGAGHVVEDNTFDANTAVGVRVEGDGSVVRRNLVFNTGGSTVTLSAWGLYGTGSVSFLDNTVSGVTATVGGKGSAYGIYTVSNTNGSIGYNRIRELAKDGSGKIYGIYNATSGRVAMEKNNLFGDDSTGSTGLTCSNSTGRARENIISGFATGLNTCGDGGNNDISP